MNPQSCCYAAAPRRILSRMELPLLDKEQYAARTIRPRLHKHLDEFLVKSGDPVARAAWPAPRGIVSLERSPALLEALPIDPLRRSAVFEGARRKRGVA
jgi:hypothetical protein